MPDTILVVYMYNTARYTYNYFLGGKISYYGFSLWNKKVSELGSKLLQFTGIYWNLKKNKLFQKNLLIG